MLVFLVVLFADQHCQALLDLGCCCSKLLSALLELRPRNVPVLVEVE